MSTGFVVVLTLIGVALVWILCEVRDMNRRSTKVEKLDRINSHLDKITAHLDEGKRLMEEILRRLDKNKEK